ncbi:MAG TPA: alpha/beta hydrolase [Thermomicrobiaceae bacterium]|jgi:pimeloyl-ACP methyl ester carboxylesterase|nr:alpha/beta hydrolase [Thermomicrobiaceae bacterium]
MESLYLPDLDAHLCYHDLPGEAPATVYLHGLGSASSADFPRIARDPRLASHGALLIDLLGFGFSDRPAAFPHTLEAHVETVARLLDHLSLRQCHVVGHSMGGSIAIALAAARPDLVSGLVVAECNLDPEDATFSQMIVDQSPTEEAYVASGHAAVIALAEEWAAANPAFGSYPGTLRAADPRAVFRCSLALVGCHLRETFFGLNVPRTFVFGALTLPDRLEPMLADAGVAVAVVPDAGHGMVGENPAAFAAIVASAMADEDRPQS